MCQQRICVFEHDKAALRHITMSSIIEVFASLKAEEILRAYDMPTDQSAIHTLLQAHTRLHELGWQDAVFCPKDGSTFEALEAGSSESGLCHYRGEWPKGRWWMQEHGSHWQAYPILWRPVHDANKFVPTAAN
jgi:hypothetical protein